MGEKIVDRDIEKNKIRDFFIIISTMSFLYIQKLEWVKVR